MHINELLPLNREAVAATLTALDEWDPADAGLATPCSEWTMDDLVAHMTVQQRGFARALAGERTGLADWQPRAEPDPVAAYRDSCAQVLDVLAGLADPDAPVLLPELRDFELPAHVVVGFHLVDNVVHAWDVAASLGRDVAFGDDVLDATLAVTRAVPDDERRDQPGAPFRRSLPVGAGTDRLSEILLLLGRDPSWRPA